MNDLRKAQAFLRSGDYKKIEVAKKLGISRMTLDRYIENLDSLNDAKWNTVYKLAQMFDVKKKLFKDNAL